MNFRFSWKRKKHVSMSSRLSAAHGEISPQGRDDKGCGRDDITLEQAQAFLNTQFNSEGLYCGDNPYLANVTVEQMLLRWQLEGTLSADDLRTLRRINL